MAIATLEESRNSGTVEVDEECDGNYYRLDWGGDGIDHEGKVAVSVCLVRVSVECDLDCAQHPICHHEGKHQQSLLDHELLCCNRADTAPLAEGDQNEQDAD